MGVTLRDHPGEPDVFVATGGIFYWRGPSPFCFVAVPDDVASALHELAARVTYGWGMIPVTATVGSTTWTTSLFPKEGGYLIPLKKLVRTSEKLEEGATITIALDVTHPTH